MGYTVKRLQKMAKDLLIFAEGAIFHQTDISPSVIGQTLQKSVAPRLSELAKAGYIIRIARGQYNFTQKAKELVRPPQFPPASKIDPRERDTADHLFLSPAEFLAFQSLNNCKPCDTGPEKHQKDRINEESIDASALDDEDRETFFAKMLRLGIFLEIGPGTRGRIIHFDLEKYLDLCDKVRVFSPVEKKLETLRPLLAEKEKQYGNLNTSMYSLENQVNREEEEIGQLEQALASLQKKVDNAKAEKDAKKARIEEIRRLIADSGGEAEIEDLKKEIAFYEAFADLSEKKKSDIVDFLFPIIS